MLFFFALSPSFSLYIRRRTNNQKEIICLGFINRALKTW